MTYAEKIRREMVWSVQTMRLCMKWNETDEQRKADLIADALRHAEKVIADDLARGNATKRQASSGRKAARSFAEYLATLDTTEDRKKKEAKQ